MNARFINIIAIAVFSFPSVAQDYSRTIRERAAITFPDQGTDDGFGSAIAANESVLAVSSHKAYVPDAGARTGAVDLFEISSGTRITRLYPEHAQQDDMFGADVAIEASTLVVGASHEDAIGERSGAAYVYDLTTLELVHILHPDEDQPYGNFGQKVAIGSGVVAVSGPQEYHGDDPAGAVYIFDAHSGERLMKITPNDRNPYQYFGSSLSISDGVIAIGADGDNNVGRGAGSVYLFDLQTGQQIREIYSSDFYWDQRFGTDVWLGENLLAVAAHLDDEGGLNAGAVYIYDRATHEFLHKVIPADSEPRQQSGWDIAMNGGRVVISAIRNSYRGDDTGMVYVYDAHTGTHLRTLDLCDRTQSNFFGYSVCFAGQDVMVSTLQNRSQQGVVFRFDPSDCPSDLNQDGVLTFQDVSLFIDEYNNAGSIADRTCDGMLNYFDVAAFLAGYFGPCD